MNYLTITGRLVSDPETLVSKKTNKKLYKYTIAHNYKDKDGENTACFIECIDARDYADMSIFKKGYPVLVSGTLAIKRYTDKNNVTRDSIRILVSSLGLESYRKKETKSDAELVEDDVNDLPF